MVDKEDTEQIVNFALVPIGSVIETCDGGNRGRLIGVGLDSNAGVVTDGQHVVDDLESLVSRRVVDGCDVGNAGKLGSGVVLEEGESGDNTGRRDVDGELVLPYGEPSKTESAGAVAEKMTLWGSGHTAECTWADRRSGTVRTRAGFEPYPGLCLREEGSGLVRTTISTIYDRALHTCGIDDWRLQLAGLSRSRGVPHIFELSNVTGQLLGACRRCGKGAHGIAGVSAAAATLEAIGCRRPQRTEEEGGGSCGHGGEREWSRWWLRWC